MEANGESLTIELRDKFKQVIEESMVEAGKYVCPNVPMAADTEGASYWKH